jgi:hypothetical protein
MPWQQGATGTWAVLDWRLMDFCSLPKEGGGNIPLAWKSRAAADAWLQNCYLIWAKWEKDGGGEVPAGWRPRPEPSPYSNGLAFPHHPH